MNEAHERKVARDTKAARKRDAKLVARERRKLALRQLELEKRGLSAERALAVAAQEKGVNGMSFHDLLAHRKGGSAAVTAQKARLQKHVDSLRTLPVGVTGMAAHSETGKSGGQDGEVHLAGSSAVPRLGASVDHIAIAKAMLEDKARDGGAT